MNNYSYFNQSTMITITQTIEALEKIKAFLIYQYEKEAIEDIDALIVKLEDVNLEYKGEKR